MNSIVIIRALVLILWSIAGLLSLEVSENISKVQYSTCWVSLIVVLIERLVNAL